MSNKELIECIYSEAIMPIKELIVKDFKFNSSKLVSDMMKVAVFAILDREKDVKEKLEKLIEEYNKLGDEFVFFADMFFLKVIKCALKFNLKEFVFKLEDYMRFLEEKVKSGFFDFESEEVDSEIEKMHYEESKKTNAVSYIKENELDEDFLADLAEAVENIENIDTENKEKFLEMAKESLEMFFRVFGNSYEFQDLAYSVSLLITKLQKTDLDALSEDKQKLLIMALEAILEDLASWYHNVIETQEAKDIHYLDASLLANIAQLDILLNQEAEDDIEFF